MAHLRLIHDNKLTAVAGSAVHPTTNDYKSQTSTNTSFTLTTSSVSGNVAVVAYLPEHNGSITTIVSTNQVTTQTIENTRWGVSKRADLLNNLTTLVFAYKRSATIPIDNPGTVNYNFTTETLEGTTSNGWTSTVPAGTSQLYVTSAVAYDSDNSDIIASTEWSLPVAVTDMLDNLYTKIVYIYAVNTSNVTSPDLSTLGTCSYNLLTDSLTGTIPSNWFLVPPVLQPGERLWVRAVAMLVPNTLRITESTSTFNESLPAGYGGGKYVAAYFSNLLPSTVYYINFSTSVKISRFVVGNYWSPKYNIPFGISTGYSDTSSSERLQSGDLYSTPGPRNKTMQFQLEYLSDEDKFQFFAILKTVGKLGCVFVSAFPQDTDKNREQMFSIYGKLNNLSQITYAQYTRYTSSVELEEF